MGWEMQLPRPDVWPHVGSHVDSPAGRPEGLSAPCLDRRGSSAPGTSPLAHAVFCSVRHPAWQPSPGVLLLCSCWHSGRPQIRCWLSEPCLRVCLWGGWRLSCACRPAVPVHGLEPLSSWGQWGSGARHAGPAIPAIAELGASLTRLPVSRPVSLWARATL